MSFQQIHKATHPTVAAEFELRSMIVLEATRTARYFWFKHKASGYVSPVADMGQPDTEKAALAWLRRQPARMDAHARGVTLNAQANASAWHQTALMHTDNGAIDLAKQAQHNAAYWQELALSHLNASE